VTFDLEALETSFDLVAPRGRRVDGRGPFGPLRRGARREAALPREPEAAERDARVTRCDLPSRERGTPLDAIEEPVSGQLVVFRQRTHDRVAGDLFVRPGGFVPVHVHAGQLERFEGVSGTLRFRCGRQRGTLGPGDAIIVPKGTPHGFRNVGREVAHFLIELTPPLRGEEGLRTLFGLQRDGRLRVTRLGVPRPVLQIAVLFDEYLDEIHLPLLPFRVQRLVFRALARLGKWRGYGSTFPEYTRTPERGLGETDEHATQLAPRFGIATPVAEHSGCLKTRGRRPPRVALGRRLRRGSLAEA
jgi:mannose-6-phosphate isomerase-like protein (cupin superfamily)